MKSDPGSGQLPHDTDAVLERLLQICQCVWNRCRLTVRLGKLVQAREQLAEALSLDRKVFANGIGDGTLVAVQLEAKALLEEPADPVDVPGIDRPFFCGEEARSPKAAVLLEDIACPCVTCGREHLAALWLDPPDVVLYIRYPLSLRQVEELLLERGSISATKP